MMNHVGEFAMGASAPLHGLRILISRRGLRRWLYLLTAVGLATFLSGLIAWGYFAGQLLPGLVTESLDLIRVPAGAAFSILYWFTIVVAWPLSLFIFVYASFLIVKIFAAPLFAKVAELILRTKGLVRPKPSIDHALQRFGLATFKLGAFSVASGLSIIFALVPGLDIAASFLVVILAAIDTIDASLEILDFPLRERFHFARQHAGFLVGLSVAMAIGFLIPVVNFVLLPAAIAGTADMMPHLLRTTTDRTRNPE